MPSAMRNNHPSHDRRAGRNAGAVTAPAGLVAGACEASPVPPNVTLFRCANCSRPATAPASTAGRPPSQPDFEWPIPVHEIALPCAGRLQPEHLLKAFEAGADAVCIITCARDDCCYIEGSLRAERRAEYVRQLLDEIGLGRERLLVCHLAPSAQDDSVLTRLKQNENGSRAVEIRDTVLARLGALPPNPLRQDRATVSRPDGARRDEANGTRDETSPRTAVR